MVAFAWVDYIGCTTRFLDWGTVVITIVNQGANVSGLTNGHSLVYRKSIADSDLENAIAFWT